VQCAGQLVSSTCEYLHAEDRPSHPTRCTADEHVRKSCPRYGREFKGGISAILDEQYI
jgi:hypothetical protein